MKRLKHLALSAFAIVLLSGCAGAAFNRLDLTVSRNITVGQELIDLQEAHEKGILNDSEYIEAKKDVLHFLDQLGDIKTK